MTQLVPVSAVDWVMECNSQAMANKIRVLVHADPSRPD